MTQYDLAEKLTAATAKVRTPRLDFSRLLRPKTYKSGLHSAKGYSFHFRLHLSEHPNNNNNNTLRGGEREESDLLLHNYIA